MKNKKIDLNNVAGGNREVKGKCTTKLGCDENGHTVTSQEQYDEIHNKTNN